MRAVVIMSPKIRRARSRRALLTALLVAGALAQASCRRHGVPERRAPEPVERASAEPSDMSNESGGPADEAVAESGAAGPARVEPSRAVAEPRGPDEPAREPAPDEDAPADPCVEDCLRRSQMRAVAWEQIQRDCAAECRGARADEGRAASG